MIAIVIGTVVGTLLSIIAAHYFRIGLRRWAKRDTHYRLPDDKEGR